MARGVKGILISPIDAVGVNAAYDAAAGNVPIVSVARGSTSPNQTLHVAMDEKQIGRDIAEWTAKKLGGKGKVAMLLGPTGAPTFRNLGHGYNEVMAKHPDIQIVFKTDGPLTRERGVKQTEDALVANPTSKRSTPPTTTSRSARCRRCWPRTASGQTIVTGMNGVPPALRAVKEGNIAMTVELNPVLWGRLGVDVPATFLKGDKVEPRVFIKHLVIDNSNIDEKLAKLRRPKAKRGASARGTAIRRRPAVAKTAEMAKQAPGGSGDNSFVAQLEAANLHPLWDRFRTLTPVRPQPRDPPLLWRWKDIEPLLRAGGLRGRDRRCRAARADPGEPGVRRRDGDDLEPDRGLHRARSRRPRAAAPAHLRGDPLRDPS